MGGRKRWPQELADRCNAVGWPAELVANGHWKARLPDGTVMGWAESPSDTNAYKNAMRVARAKGLEDLELQLKLQREKERLERIERDRRLNGVPESAYGPGPATQPESEPELKTPATSSNLGFVEVEGQRLGIMEQAEAWFQPSRGGERRLVEDARELMLIDHSVHYQCLRGTGTFQGEDEVFCNRLFDTPSGVFFHQARTHKLAEEAAQRMQPHPASAPRAEEAPMAVSQPGLVARMVALTGRFEQLCNDLDQVGESANALYNELQGLVRELPAELASDELRDKAARFERMIEAANQ